MHPLLVTGGEGGFALWSTVDGKQAQAPPQTLTGKVRLAAFSPDGVTLATIDAGDRDDDPLRLRLWRAAR